MPNVVIVGAQWGDEGKGKIVDLLTGKVQVVARYNGGHNAGHTIRVGDDQFVLRLIPSGVLHPGILCLMGNGMVIDPWALEAELAELKSKGVAADDNLLISDRAHLILPHHRALEALAEELRGSRKIGTTLRGIGPAYEDKSARRGLRMGDLVRPGTLAAKLEDARRHYELVYRGAGRDPAVDWDALLGDLFGFGERLRSRITDVSLVLHRHLAQGYSVLFEGAQATLLDLDHGTYPFVTSSSPIAAGAAVSFGIGPQRIDEVLGVSKAYVTRVGEGPFPSEIQGEAQQRVRELGGEFGTVTGRERRCGWIDLVALRFAVRVNGITSLALTKLDVLSEFAEIPLCVRYRLPDGTETDDFPAHQSDFHHCAPVFETLGGWQRALDEDVLPPAARAYVDFVADALGVPVALVGTGAGREAVLALD